jgi:dienelactone hydrolase
VTSHWTRDGAPLPFVPFAQDWEPDAEDTGPPVYRSLYEQSLAADPAVAERAAIPVEQIRGEVVLVAGADDQLWPSVSFARLIEARRASHGLTTTVVTHPRAGHRVVLPGEDPVSGGQRMARGGTPQADAELGERAWPAVLAALS